ncbi:MAG: alpha-E domain-containing protein, partial [Gammaproteobacteria bacterium]
MLSRVAETIYWMGRYLERAENVARIIEVNTNLMLDLPKGMELGWTPLIAILGADELYREKHDEYTERRVMNFLVSEMENPSSILASLAAARENARTIRETIPRKAWEELNALYQYAEDKQRSAVGRKGRYDYLENIIQGSQMLVGILAGTMNHDQAYSFMNIGRKLERADMTTRIIDVRSDTLLADNEGELRTFDDYQWVSLLKSMTAHQMYRRAMQTRVRRVEVLRFLFRHPDFPRSIMYCLNSLADYVAMLPKPRLVRAVAVSARPERFSALSMSPVAVGAFS